jgi:hypothetical protein
MFNLSLNRARVARIECGPHFVFSELRADSRTAEFEIVLIAKCAQTLAGGLGLLYLWFSPWSRASQHAKPSREPSAMQLAASTDDETIAALDQMKRSVRMAFCGVMQSTRLPPMAALSLAATAVGLIYLEVAAAHRGDNPCPCGWEPRSAADLDALQTSLALAAKPPRADFRAIQAAGNA